MKYIFSLLLLVSFVCDAQVKQQLGTYGVRTRRMQMDSAGRIPTVQVGIKDAYAGFDTAQVYYNKTDSTVKVYTGSQWIDAVRSANTGSWLTTGNAGTDTSVNFWGTTGNTGIVARSNGRRMLKLDGDEWRAAINNGYAMSEYALAMNFGLVGVKYASTSYTSSTRKIVFTGVDYTTVLQATDKLYGYEVDNIDAEFFATISTSTFTGGNTEVVLTTDPIGGNSLDIWIFNITRINTSTSEYATAIGHYNVAQGNYSYVSGYRNYASGDYSAVLGGTLNVASGGYSTAFGAINTASGIYSTAFGNGATSSGTASFAYGLTSIASGTAAISMGNVVTASGIISTAFGDEGSSSGAVSTSFGRGIKSKSYAGFVIGSYNDSTDAASATAHNSANRVFQIGIGTANAARSNAMTVLQGGNVGIGITAPTQLLEVAGNIKYTGQVASTKQTVTYGPTTTWDWNAGTNAEVTLTGNITTFTITNAVAGTYATIRMIQDGTGSRLLSALPANSKVFNGGAGAITLSTAAGAIDLLTCYFDGTNYYWNYALNYN